MLVKKIFALKSSYFNIGFTILKKTQALGDIGALQERVYMHN